MESNNMSLAAPNNPQSMYDVYCDESGLEAITNKDAHKWAGIGSIWMPQGNRIKFKSDISIIKAKHGITGELKWSKVSPAHFELYKEIIEYFFNNREIGFRIILIEASKLDNVMFHNSDNELCFYKFYYQLLLHWLFDNLSYSIYVDYKVNRDKGRLQNMKSFLLKKKPLSNINVLQSLKSDESLGIQLADILTGLVVSKFNNEITGSAKLGLIDFVENDNLHHEIKHTSSNNLKFNVFKINLKKWTDDLPF